MLMKIGGIGLGGRVIGSSEPAGQTAHIFLTIGNSHNIGRPTASGDTFDAKVWEWTQGDALAQPAAAMLDHQNDTTTDISPDLSFSADYIAANPTIDRLVFVPHARGSTGFSDNAWSADTVPNDLSSAVTRFNAAYAQLIADGYTVTVGGAFWHANRPDFDSNSHEQYQIDIDAMAAYLRANLTDGANIKFAIGAGMTKVQLDGRGLSKDLNFQAIVDGTQHRVAYTGTYDWINSPRYGKTYAGLPVQTTDGVHADRLGVIEQGHLRYDALLRAQANTKPSDPFQSLASWSDWKAFHDFRTGTGLDMTGNGFHAAQADAVTNTANMKYDTVTRSMVYDRIAADVARYFHAGVQLGASYTKALFLRFDDLSATIGIFQNHDEGVRFFYTVGSNEIRAYHSSSSARVDISGNDIILGKWHSLVVTYDEPTTTMKIYLDGVLKGTNAAVAAHPAVVNEAIGAQNLVGLRGFRGAMMYAAHSYSAMDQTAITALNTVSQNLVTPFVVQTPDEIPALFSWRNPRIDISVTRDGGELVSNEQDTFGSLDALQSDEPHKPLYVPASNYVQYGGGAGNQEFLEMGAVAFGSDDFSISIWGYSDVQT
ncbi:MAG: hypothetical protein JKY93_01190, partial [Gammaproteobacteria bacterium]|nr:hypothetical protein [Gammaproteobacteria bacterium]